MVFCLLHQFHPFQDFLVGGYAYRYIDADGFNPGMAQHVGQMGQVLFHLIEHPGKQMPEIVRKYLVGCEGSRRMRIPAP